MSSVGSAHTPHGDTTTTRRGSRTWTDGRFLVGSLIVVIALAIALTDYAGFSYAWSYFSRSSETSSSASTSEVFGGLKSKFRDYNTYSRDIFLMEERSKVDAPYLATIARLLENPTESAGAGPMIEAFLDLREVLDLEQSCTAGYPWSTPVWSARRDIDTMADGSKLVALDLFFCCSPCQGTKAASFATRSPPSRLLPTRAGNCLRSTPTSVPTMRGMGCDG